MKRPLRSALIAAVAILTLFLTGLPEAARYAEPRLDVIAPQLRATLTALPAGAQVEYLVAVAGSPVAATTDRADAVAALRQVAVQSQRPVLDDLRRQGAEVLNTFWLGNLVLVRSPKETVPEVTGNRAVTRIYPVETFEVTEPAPVSDAAVTDVEDRTWGIDRIGAHRVWDELGVDGSGTRVAVLDTGVNLRHPDLAGRMVTDDAADPMYPGGWMEWDASGNPVSGQPRDTQGHGTHVSGTVLGGAANGTHIGVAPGARLMHGLVLPNGSGTTPQIIAGMQWAVAPYDAEGNPAGQAADVVNMSFGPSAGGRNEAFVAPIRAMYAAGVLPVAAAGNCGDGCHGSPANIPEALAVGATDDTDTVATFSGGGTVTRDDWSDPPADWPASWVVPDVSAPGVDVYSSTSSGFGPGYGRMNGTSMAAPHVAGTAALMLSANPGLSPAKIVEALRATSFFDDRHGTTRPNDRFGQGRIDAFQATSLVALASGVSGRVVDGGTGDPVPDVQVAVVDAGVVLRTVADGRFEFRLPSGSYTLELRWAGRIVATLPDVAVGEGVTSIDVQLAGVAGVVRDAGTGAMLAGVDVAATDTGVAVKTGEDGTYRMYLSPGRYPLRLSTFGYAELTVPAVEVVAGGVIAVDRQLTLLPTGTVTGRVTYEASGYGVPGVTVTLVDGPRSAVTDGSGRYTIADVPMGGHQVVARPQLFAEPAPTAVTVAAGAAATVDFPLTCGGECSGLWNARYSGPVETGLDFAKAAVASPDGSRLFVAGSSTGVGTSVDALTIAYEPATGRQLWVASYDGPAHYQDGANDIAISPDGTRVYVTGLSVRYGTSTSAADYITLAYDTATGAQLWEARYNAPADAFDNARSVDVSPDGTRVFVTGQVTVRGSTSHTDYGTVAYDAVTGAQQWVAFYDGPTSGYEAAVALVAGGDAVYVTGQSPGQGSSWDYGTVAYDAATGAQRWVTRHNGPARGLDQPTALAISPDAGRLFVTGAAASGTGADYGTVAYDTADGTQVWTARYDGPGHGTDQATAVAVSPDGAAIYVTGGSSSGAAGSPSDYATVAYDAATGAERWTTRYDGPAGGVDRGVSVAASPDGSQVVVTGQSDGAGVDFATVAYATGTGIQRWVARYNGPPGDDDAPSTVTVSGSRVYVTGDSDTGIGDDPLTSPSDVVTIAYDADGSAQSPVFVAHDLRVLPAVAAPDGPVRVVAEVTNVGTGAGEYAATLLVDGVPGTATRVTLAPGGHTRVEWQLAPPGPGGHQVRFGPLAAEVRVLACDRTVSGVHNGPLTVTAGVTCLAAGATVRGPVTVRPGAGLLATGAKVTGPVSADGASVVGLYDTDVTGPLTVTGATDVVSLVASLVTGPVQLSGNHAPVVVAGNEIRGPLSCDGNTPAPVDQQEPNTVTGPSSGQCADLRRR